MGGPVRDGRAMIAAMAPRLDSRRWRFVLVQPDTAPQLLGAAIGTFRADEGVGSPWRESAVRVHWRHRRHAWQV